MERNFSKIYFDNDFGNTLNFPLATKGLSWRGFLKFSIFLSLFLFLLVYGINKLIYVPMGVTKIVKYISFGLISLAVLGYFNNIRCRWRYFERETLRNDRDTKKFKNNFASRFDIDGKTEKVRTKEKKDKQDNYHLEAISVFRNATFSINTREELNHEVNRYYSILFKKPKNDSVESFLNQYLREGSVETKTNKADNNKNEPAIARTAKQVIYDLTGKNLPFSDIKYQPNGDSYIEAIENLGKDPWYYTKITTDLREQKKNSTMQHTVPYKPCVYNGIAFSGFTDYTEQNNIKKEKAMKWLNENIGTILRILDENGFAVQYVPENTEIRQSTAEIEFTMPANMKAGATKGKIYMEVADVIDQKLDLVGSAMEADLDRLKLSLALPNGKKRDKMTVRKDDEGNVEDYTLTLNLEDILRDLYG